MNINTAFAELENPLLESLGIGLWEFHIAAERIQISTTAQKLILSDTSELSLRNFMAMLYDEDRTDTYNSLKSLIAEGQAFEIDVRLQNPEPFHHWVHLQGSQYKNASGELVIGGYVQDTSRKTLLKHIQNKMRNLLSNVIEHIDAQQTLKKLCEAVNSVEPAIHCVIVLNSDTTDEQTFIHAKSLPASLETILRSITLSNDQSELFYTSEKRRALVISDLYRLESWRTIEQLNLDDQFQTYVGQSIYCNDNRLQGTVCLYLPDDSLGEETLSQVIHELHNIATIIIEQQLQIDTKDKIQQQLNHSQKMDSLGHLTGGIAHDFNNILGSIIGYNSLSSKVAKQLNHEKLSSYLNEVGVAAERARDLISQMMVFSRSEPSRPVIIDAQIVIKEVIQLIRSMIASSVNINASYSKHCPKIKINPISLHQVLLNHLINAKDAMHDDSGKIQINLFPAFRVSQTCQSCQGRFTGNYVAVEISDNGQGIASETIPKILNPFFTTKEVGRGTGMGLSVVHGILHDVDAHITVKSQLGKGTKITLYFPEVDSDQETDVIITEALVADREMSVGKGQRVMVIDDDVPLTFLLAEILESYGYKVSRFEYPQEALFEFQNHADRYDLIITDQTMPEMTGDVLSVEMLKLNPNIPIIICTGYSKKLTAAMAEEIGIVNVLRKPVETHQLLEAVQTSLKEQTK
ncbi:MAG: response regulator [Enterobacterales bacterium]|nr:response regulator [Enterobacterales bacterium]